MHFTLGYYKSIHITTDKVVYLHKGLISLTPVRSLEGAYSRRQYGLVVVVNQFYLAMAKGVQS